MTSASGALNGPALNCAVDLDWTEVMLFGAIKIKVDM